MIKYLNLILALVLSLAMLLSGCGKAQGEYDADTNADNDTADVVSTVDTSSMDFELSNRDTDASYESISSSITLSGSTASVDGAGAKAKSGEITISLAGTHTVTGSATDTVIIVDADKADKIQIVLNNATIKNSGGPAILIKRADKVFLTLAEGSTNVLEDGSDYTLTVDDSTVDAAIFSKEDLTVNGSGSLTVNGNLKHGIVSKDDLVISDSTLNVTAKNVAISGKDCVKLNNADITANAGTDGVRSDNSEDTNRGFVYVNGTTLNLIAGNDGIQAQTVLKTENAQINATTGEGSANASTNADGSFNHGWGFARPGSSKTNSSADEESAKGLKAGSDMLISGGSFNIDSADDSLHSNGTIKISSGSFKLSSGDDGIHADTSLAIADGEIIISKSYEGLEATDIVISGGNIDVTATDDGINAAGGNDSSAMGDRPGQNSFSGSSGSIQISGGYILLNAAGDGIDSNGTVAVSGGITLVNGPTNSGNGFFDYQTSASVSGGVLIAVGTAGMAQNFTSAENQGAILTTIGNQIGGTSLALCDSSGKAVVAFTPQRAYECMVITSPDISSGNDYTIVVGAAVSGADKNGFAQNADCTGGTTATTVTLTSNIYGATGGMGGGMHGGFGGGGKRW